MQKMIALLLVALLSAGSAWAQTADLLVYKVREAGMDPYVSRMIVTEEFVRLDEGENSDGFALYDRTQEILYNVLTSEQTIMVMNPESPSPDENLALILQEKVEADPQAPSVAGYKPTEVTLLANGEVCSELVVLEGAMEDAVEGLAELKLMLARVQASTLKATPLEMRTPCDLAANIHAADRSLRFGLPMLERSKGRNQSLVDFSDSFEVDDSTFRLPADFARRPMMAPGGH